MEVTDKFITDIIDAAGAAVADGVMVSPTYFIGNDLQKHILHADYSSVEAKEESAMMVRRLAKELDADYVLHVSESWAIKDIEAGKDYQSNQAKYKYSMSNHPKAVEIVIFNLETHDKVLMGFGDIISNSDKRTLGKVSWNETEIFGRFSNFLKPRIVKLNG